MVVRTAESAGTPRGDVLVRIENATSSTAEVQIEVTAAADETTATAGKRFLAPGTSPAAAQEGDPSAESSEPTIVRVDAGSYTEGIVTCGMETVLRATVGDQGQTPVLLQGAGTGTPGFDTGSVGLSGERILLFADHLYCGDTIVVRLSDDGSGVGGSSGATGLGEVSVYGPNNVPPVGDLPMVEGTGSGTSNNGAGADTNQLDIEIENQTGSGIEFTFQVGTGDETDPSTIVNVLPAGTATGTLACAQQVSVRALIIDASTGVDGSEPTLYQVTLVGSGTGTVGFEGNTAGPGNIRYLQRDTHYACGDTVYLVITDDGSSIDEGVDGQARVGLGSVAVFGDLP